MFRTRSFLLAVAAAALLAVGCAPGGGFSQPSGWAEPVFEGATVHLFPERDLLAALRPGQSGDTVWDTDWVFPDDNISTQEDIDLGAAYGAPLVTADRIILATFEGQLLAISREGRFGEGSWMRDDINGAIVGGAALAGDRLLFGTTERRLYARALDGGGAVPNWPLDGLRLDGEIWARPAVSGGTAFVATMDGTIHAFDVESGARRWAAPFDAGGAIAELALIDGSSAGYQELLFVPTLGKRVWLVDPASGRALHEPYVADHWVWTTPAVADGVAWFGDFAGRVHALDLASGRARWATPYDTGSKVKARPVRIGETLIVGDEKGYVHFLDAATGALRNPNPWTDGDVGKFRAAFVARDGFAWALGTKGRLYRADPETLTVVEIGLRGLP